MKYVTLLLTLCISLSANAQTSFEVGLMVGGHMNTSVFKDVTLYGGYEMDFRGVISPACNLSATLIRKKHQFGLGIYAARHGSKLDMEFAKGETYIVTLGYGNPNIAPYLFYNRMFDIAKDMAYLYAGISLGGVIGTQNKPSGNDNRIYSPTLRNTLGAVGGLQIGGKIRLTKRMWGQAEVAGRHYRCRGDFYDELFTGIPNSTPTKQNYYFYDFPIMIGISYKL